MARETGSREAGAGRESTAVSQRRWRPAGMGTGASPFSLMRRMAENMDRIFDNMGIASAPALFDRDLWRGGDLEQFWTPQLETFRRGDELVIRADLPGMKKEDVEIEVEKDTLRISGERREEKEEERDEYYRSERSYGRFFRSLRLPEGVSAEQVKATFRDGVLEITLPAPKQQQRGQRIDIK